MMVHKFPLDILVSLCTLTLVYPSGESMVSSLIETDPFSCYEIRRIRSWILSDLSFIGPNSKNKSYVLFREHLDLCNLDTSELFIEGPITDIAPNAFSKLSRLTQLTITADIVELTSDHLGSASDLEILRLYLPQLRRIKGRVFRNESSVTLYTGDGNYIEEEIFSGTSIRSLCLVGQFSHMERGCLANMSLLETLEIRNSRILSFNIDHLTENTSRGIQNLNLTNNSIVYLDEQSFRGLRNLELVDLTGNGISTLGTRIFTTNQLLSHVRLADNRISYLGRDTFSTEAPLRQLQVLDLSFNYLPILEADVFAQMPALRGITIVGNPFKCNCLKQIWKNLETLGVIEVKCKGFYQGQYPVCIAAEEGHESCNSMEYSLAYVYKYRAELDGIGIYDIIDDCKHNADRIFITRYYK